MGSRNGGIRKLSMKKFGTPIGAGPGNDREEVGFDGAGAPFWFEDSFEGDLAWALGFGFGFALSLLGV
jgi:hypothetical protein